MSNLVWLTVLGLLNSAVAAYYYLRILVVMYLKEPGDSVDDARRPPASALKIAVYGSALGRCCSESSPLVLDFATRAALK